MNQQNRSWDLGRFLQTLLYFEAIPVISDLQRWFTDRPQSQTLSRDKNNEMGVILVTGATGGVGKRVVRRLLERKYQVRALVRDGDRARAMLGDLELFEADITLSETLTPALMEGVTAVICCTGTRVQPVEGDTPNREKYYQGVKFYLPEVVDSPELVEYRGIKNLVEAASKLSLKKGQRLLFDFANPSAAVQEVWGAVDDVVMGGVSQSSIRLVGNKAIFSGNVSTENSGGFASVRTRNFSPPWNLSAHEGIQLRVRGDGKRYKFIIRNEESWDGIGYSYSFDTVRNDWLTVQIPFANLIPVFRAKTVPEAGNFNAGNVCSMQLMLSKFEYDRALNPTFEPGLFTLEVESVSAYGGELTPQFVLVSSAGVTRPGRPDLDLEKEPPAVRMNDQLGGILTWKLKGEEVLRESKLAYTIVRPCALTETTEEKTLLLAQGDNIRGQISREAIAELCIQALQYPQACYKTFEVREQSDGKNDWKSLFASLKPDQ